MEGGLPYSLAEVKEAVRRLTWDGKSPEQIAELMSLTAELVQLVEVWPSGATP
jgi:hypothetical protein